MRRDPLIEGEWYWVRTHTDRHWFPALREMASVGGWTNADTWEDWASDIAEWVHIVKPEE